MDVISDVLENCCDRPFWSYEGQKPAFSNMELVAGEYRVQKLHNKVYQYAQVSPKDFEVLGRFGSKLERFSVILRQVRHCFRYLQLTADIFICSLRLKMDLFG